jgi:hypothetical protein
LKRTLKADKTLCVTSFYINKTEGKMLKYLKIHSSILCTLTLALLIGCSAEESIKPTWNPDPIDRQLTERPFLVSLPIDGQEVPDFAGELLDVQDLGMIFQELFKEIANAAIEEQEGLDYEIEPIIYFANELDNISDWDYIQRLGINSVRLDIVDAEDMELANLGFIDDLNIYLDFVEPSADQLTRQGRGLLLASYNAEENKENLGCLGRCLDLVIHDLPWKKIAQENRTFVIYIELKVNSVNQTKMKIGGKVDAFFGLKIGL